MVFAHAHACPTASSNSDFAARLNPPARRLLLVADERVRLRHNGALIPRTRGKKLADVGGLGAPLRASCNAMQPRGGPCPLRLIKIGNGGLGLIHVLLITHVKITGLLHLSVRLTPPLIDDDDG